MSQDTAHAQNGHGYEAEPATTAAPQTPESNWLLCHAGSFADDPFWDDMMEFIKADRRKYG